MENSIKSRLSTIAMALFALYAFADPATGWKQTGAGPYDYNDTANWVNGEINGIFGSDLTLTAAQTITFAADTTLPDGLTIAYSGAYRMYFMTAAEAGGEVTLKLQGGILLDTVDNGNVIVDFGSTTAGRGILLDLDGGVRTVETTGTKHEIRFLNRITNGGINLKNKSKVTFNSTASDYTLGTTFNGSGQVVLMQNSLGTGPLTFNATTSLGTSGNRTFTNNNKLIFNAGLTVSGANGSLNLGAGDIVINEPISISMSKNTFTLGGQIAENSPYGIDAISFADVGGTLVTYANLVADGDVELSTAKQWDFHGVISGSGRVIKTGGGEMDLFAQNTFTGKFVIRGGKVRFRATNVFPSLAGMFLVESDGELRSNSGQEAGYLSAPRMLYMVDKASTGALGFDSSASDNLDLTEYPTLRLAPSGGDVSYTGNITAPSSGVLRIGGGGKTFKIGGTISGATEIDASTGSIRFDMSQPDFDGTVTCGAGYTITVASGVELPGADLVSDGGTIVLGAAKAGDFNCARSVTLNTAQMTVNSPSAGDVVLRITGALKTGVYEKSSGGISRVTMTNTVAYASTLSVGSISNVKGAEMLNVVYGATGTGVSRLFVTTSVEMVGSGEVGSIYTPVIPFVRVDNSPATYDPTAGVRALAAGEYTVYEAGYEGPVLHSGENLATTGNGTITLTGSASVNSIWMMGASSSDQTLAVSEGVTLTVASGAIQVNSYGASVYAVPTDFVSRRGYFSGRAGVAWTLSGAISGSGGITFADNSLAQSSKGVKLNTGADFSGDCYVFGYCWFESVAGSFFPNGTERLGDMYDFGYLQWKGTNVRINGLNGAGRIYQDGSATGSLTTGCDGSGGNYIGSFVNGKSNFGLTKEGSGTQRFDSTMGFKSSGIVNGGNLQIDGSLTMIQDGSAKNNVIVKNGATLSGSGTISGVLREVIESGGILAPGSAENPNVPMKLGKDLDMEQGASMKFYIGDDRVSQAIVSEGYGVTGTATSIPVTVDYAASKAGTWMLLEADTFNGKTFAFTRKVDGGHLSVLTDVETGREQLWFEKTTGMSIIIR